MIYRIYIKRRLWKFAKKNYKLQNVISSDWAYLNIKSDQSEDKWAVGCRVAESCKFPKGWERFTQIAILTPGKVPEYDCPNSICKRTAGPGFSRRYNYDRL